LVPSAKKKLSVLLFPIAAVQVRCTSCIGITLAVTSSLNNKQHVVDVPEPAFLVHHELPASTYPVDGDG
jgi:hypothetical protein